MGRGMEATLYLEFKSSPIFFKSALYHLPYELLSLHKKTQKCEPLSEALTPQGLHISAKRRVRLALFYQ